MLALQDLALLMVLALKGVGMAWADAQCFKRADLLTKIIYSAICHQIGDYEVSLEPAWQKLSGFGQKTKPNQAKTKNIAEAMFLGQFWGYSDIFGIKKYILKLGI